MSLFRLGVGLFAISVLCAPLAIALATLSGIGHRWTDILVQFSAPALVATVLVSILLAVSGWRWQALFGAGVCSLLLVAVWPQWSPPRAAPQPGAAVIRLYSANLWVGNEDVEAISRSIDRADADIVVLIELGDTPAARLDEILKAYPHRITSVRVRRPNGATRSLIASRYPLQGLWSLPEGTHMIGAVIDTPVGPVNVIGAHLTRPWPFQYQWGQIIQAQKLAEYRHRLTGPVIVAGDFNSVSSGRIGRLVRSEADLVPAGGWPGTWPSALPPMFGITIDQVWRSRDLTFVSRRLAAPTGSDHRAVVTEFTLAAR
ncbi:endonuclease [Rhizobium sp. CRIBSB]|nr:endonuclease [Rhizobium sp. CRIBSB]